MTRFIAIRLASGFVSLLVFVTVLFFVVDLAVDGDWTSQFILTADQRAALQNELGIGRPLWDQYRSWLSAVATLDFGVSLSGADVGASIREALASSALVLTVGLAISFALGSWLGRSTAWRRRSALTGLVTFVAVICLTAFPPALAFFLERGTRNVVGSGELVDLQRLESSRWPAGASPSSTLWQMVALILLALAVAALVARLMRGRRGRGLAVGLVAVGAPVLVWAATGEGSRVLDLLGQLSLLTAGLVVLTFGEVVLIRRAAMDDVRSDGFVMSGRAIGLTPAQVRRRAARVTVLPVLSRLVVAIPAFLTGLVILEGVFHVGGMGSLIFEALRLQDTPLVAGGLLVVGVLTVGLRVVMDVAHLVLDPRIARAAGGDDG